MSSELDFEAKSVIYNPDDRYVLIYAMIHDRILNRYICLSRCPDLDYNTLRFLEQKIQQIVQCVLWLVKVTNDDRFDAYPFPVN